MRYYLIALALIGVMMPTTVFAANSPDGTVSVAPSGTPLTTAAGTWTWGATQPQPGQYQIFLNSNNTSGWAAEMEVANCGQFYALNTSGNQWYVYGSSGWATATAPAAPQPPASGCGGSGGNSGGGSGGAASYTPRVVSAATIPVLGDGDFIVVSPSCPATGCIVTWSCPATGTFHFAVKDGAGSDVTAPIVLTPSSGTIDAQPSVVLQLSLAPVPAGGSGLGALMTDFAEIICDVNGNSWVY